MLLSSPGCAGPPHPANRGGRAGGFGHGAGRCPTSSHGAAGNKGLSRLCKGAKPPEMDVREQGSRLSRGRPPHPEGLFVVLVWVWGVFPSLPAVHAEPSSEEDVKCPRKNLGLFPALELLTPHLSLARSRCQDGAVSPSPRGSGKGDTPPAGAAVFFQRDLVLCKSLGLFFLFHHAACQRAPPCHQTPAAAAAPSQTPAGDGSASAHQRWGWPCSSHIPLHRERADDILLGFQRTGKY